MTDPDLAWRKSSFSNDQGECVEIAYQAQVAIRDSKNPGPQLILGRTAWQHLIQFGQSPY